MAIERPIAVRVGVLGIRPATVLVEVDQSIFIRIGIPIPIPRGERIKARPVDRLPPIGEPVFIEVVYRLRNQLGKGERRVICDELAGCHSHDRIVPVACMHRILGTKGPGSVVQTVGHVLGVIEAQVDDQRAVVYHGDAAIRFGGGGVGRGDGRTVGCAIGRRYNGLKEVPRRVNDFLVAEVDLGLGAGPRPDSDFIHNTVQAVTAKQGLSA